MKKSISLIALLCAALTCASSGCRKKPDTNKNSDFEAAASKFAIAEPAPAPAAAAAGEAPAPAPARPPAQEMQQAVQEYKGGKFEDAVTRLQNLRATPTMSPQQRMALNDAMAAVMGDIYALAAKGDQRAVQAVKQYEKMQNQRR